MGEAIVKAISSKSSARDIFVVDANKETLARLKKSYKNINVSLDAGKNMENADAIILAVKPQSFAELAKEIKNKIPKNALVISIMAGQTVKNIENLLGAKKIIRTMPNLGARFGQSMTGWTAKNISAEDKKFVEEILSFLGAQIYLKNEDMIDKVTAVSGSGPAFMFYFIEAYVDEAVKLGFSQKEAEMLVLQTLQASNTLLQERSQSARSLREQVTSKAGTTEAGLSVLMDGKLAKILGKTLEKAHKRAKELSKS